MVSFTQTVDRMARGTPVRRAMSLLEFTAVLAIVGVLASAAVTRFGYDSLSNGGAEGWARRLALALAHARRATISTGDNHYLQLSSSGSQVTSYALFRRTGGGDVQVDQTWQIPDDVTVTCANSQLEFDFEGQALAGYTLDVAGNGRSWNLTVVMLTGVVSVTETTP